MRDSTPGRQLRPSYGKNIITGQADGKDTAGPEDTLSVGGEDVAPLRKGNNGNSAVVGSGPCSGSSSTRETTPSSPETDTK